MSAVAIGAGGMGEVYKARDTRLDRTIAIKISAAEFSERFEREACDDRHCHDLGGLIGMHPSQFGLESVEQIAACLDY
jgi:serine/threonine protein kinase